MGNKIFLLLFTSVVLSPKYGESDFCEYEKSMRKKNIPRSSVSYIFRKKEK